MSKIKFLAGAALAISALASAHPATAATAPSLHVRCDGSPDNVTGAETAARLLAITAVVGLLLPGPEQADSTARLSGADGVAICDAALANESNEVRRAQLILARAMHRIEAGEHQAAIDDARALAADRPAFAATAPYQLSFRLSALEVEALAHIHAGRVREGVNKAMEMAAAAPYDLMAHLRAARYVGLTGEYGEGERAFFDRLVRLYPAGLADRAHARMLAGDFRGGAEDFLLFDSLAESAFGSHLTGALAHAALAQALSDQTELADRTVARAQEAIEANAGKTNVDVAPAREMLDLVRIVRMAQGGRADDARLLFAARSGWTAVSSAAVGRVAQMLRQGAAPAQLTGLLAEDPAKFRDDALATRLTALREAGPKTNFLMIRPYLAPRAFSAFSDNVWRTDRSRYFDRTWDERHARGVTVVRNGGGTPSGYALLLHSALVAQAEGKSSFMIMPIQSAIYSARVRTGNEGEEGMFAPLSFNAAQVIQDLSPLFPQQGGRRRR